MDPKVEQLHSQAKSLTATFKQVHGTHYTDEAIVLHRQALELCPPTHPKRSESLRWLAGNLFDRYRQQGMIVDLEEAIILEREALALSPSGHPDQSTSLRNLAVSLSARYEQLGKMEDINEAIALNRDALILRQPGHPGRMICLDNLSLDLRIRYEKTGAVEDLNEAILLDREALALCSPEHPQRPPLLGNLAVHLFARYERHGRMEDLEEAIILDRDALAIYSPGDPDRPRCSINLSVRLFARYEQLRTIVDLNQAIALIRDALALLPPRCPDRSKALRSLATGLCTRYVELGRVVDLNEAIVLDREALALRPPGHPRRSISLDSLAADLSIRYKQMRAIGDLDEAIVLDREALALCSQGHFERPLVLGNLAVHLSTRYKQVGRMADLDEAIALDREALLLRPSGRPDWSLSLINLTTHLRIRFKQLSQLNDKEEIFSLFSQLAGVVHVVSSTDLSVTREWISVAEEFQHPTTLLAYETSLRLLIHHLAAIPSLPQHPTVLKNLTSSLAVDAFSACLRNRSSSHAVELLEQGRGVFWNQLSRLRSPLDDVIASGPAGETLAENFTQVTSLIRNALDSPGVDQHDRVYHLNIELQKVVTGIRELPGLSRFLLPSFFSDLQQAASEGPVIIVNASQYSCDALVVLSHGDPVHIPLSITKEHVQELSLRLRTLTVRTKVMNVTKELAVALRELWDAIVSRIVDFLVATYPRGSRIWWCPTAEFSLLPLHAAGPYRKGQLNLTDLYISSYTPTLTTLIRARRRDPSNSATQPKRFLAIGQAKAIRERELLSVGTELVNIGRRFDDLSTFTSIEGSESTVSRVTEELGGTQWVHFACHGLPNQNRPFESAFALHDGHFTIQHIIQCELQDPEFAYLSACHTTVGYKESPDEVIHLASAMQFAGFRSVIGTMWAVDDAHTNRITSMFYDHMVDESGRLDHARAAYALNKTMKKLRDIPFDQRILYIHLGA